MNEKAKKHLSSAAVGSLIGGVGSGVLLGMAPLVIACTTFAGFIISMVVLTTLCK